MECALAASRKCRQPFVHRFLRLKGKAQLLQPSSCQSAATRFELQCIADSRSTQEIEDCQDMIVKVRSPSACLLQSCTSLATQVSRCWHGMCRNATDNGRVHVRNLQSNSVTELCRGCKMFKAARSYIFRAISECASLNPSW